MKVKDIKYNPSNPRFIKGDDFEKLKKSIEDFPKMMRLRPMVINPDNIVLGGNQRLKAIEELGYKEIPEEWVVRADELTEEEQRRFIIVDNVGFGAWDWNIIEADDWDLKELENWGLELPDFSDSGSEDSSNGEDEKHYTKKVETPEYEPNNEKPDVKELFNDEKYRELVTNIEESNVPEGVANFLKVAASRHIVFDYENIADFYAHADKETQELIEQSALVIIDFNRAIRDGYVQLGEKIREQYLKDYPNE